ncbi:DNA repair protein Rad50 [Flavivirga amylovorans]|uniref:DNA repair protein Rad50 n=1 Tax=Flavivirga amylovorans TaxID=870486 RepID=A0ABT8WXN6_9FLAO|nr:DNA repair protein Rad50 [Flavivirga amylovorans]MDO5986154.1 DNA repair protein Rad50 [Flavivirga amylovorans]
MKIYPKIKRLSTLGIIHHQNFDYEFNSFRTDFVGEGGSGKSLISDLLQLIFVGTSVFYSPTISAEERLPKTMVLPRKGRGTDYGYAFLNIETLEANYIVIGIYLESSGASQMFIIQNGNDFSEDTKLVPFSTLLSYSDLIQDGEILPIERVKEHISDVIGITCESWQKLGRYHKILCNTENSIIPVDISKNRKALLSYSNIIQAFSRRSLDISKSEKLKRFLFGDEAEKKFKDNFNKAVTELNSDVEEYKENSSEIQKLKNKHTELADLLKIKKQRDTLKEYYLLAKYHHLNNKNNITEKEVKTVLGKYNRSIEALSCLKVIVREKIEIIKSELDKIEKNYQNTVDTKNEWKTKSDSIKFFFGWMEKFDCGKEEVLNKYRLYHKSKSKIDNINLLIEKLNQKDIFTFFEQKSWGKNILLEIVTEINNISESILTKNKLKSLNNINNPNSLAYWAMNLKRALNLQEESIIHKYQREDIKVDEPSTPNYRYVPRPKELIEDFNVYKTEQNGFWINLNGIKEFIEHVNEPVFDKLDKNEIEKYFKSQSNLLEDDIAELQKNKTLYNTLKDVFESLDNPSGYIQDWNSRKEIKDTEHYELYDLTPDEIEKYASLFDSANQIDEQVNLANKAFNEIDKKRTNLKTLLNNLETELEDFVEPIELSQISEYVKKFGYQSDKADSDNIVANRLESSKSYFRELQAITREKTLDINPLETLKELDEQYDESQKLANKISIDFVREFDKEVAKEIQDRVLNKEELESLENNWNGKERSYLVSYNTLASNYMENNYERYKDTGDFKGLCEEILPPEIFDGDEVLEEEVIERINKRLRDINIKNQQLNGRKLQKLNSIIDEVNSEVSLQLDYVRRVRNFLNSDNKIITGNHKATLKQSLNNSFPREWMQDFIDKVNEELSLGVEKSLMEPLKSFTNELESFVSLEDKMIEAFHRCGGSRTIRPTIEMLLSPQSYYDLSFFIKSKLGKNSGSTSQTYSAIALLCIARLSLIDKETPLAKEAKPGIRFMPIDEAEGLGSNFDMLYEIAKENDYQLLSLSIRPNKVDAKNQNIYLLQNNLEVEDRVNYDPIPIFGNFDEN